MMRPGLARPAVEHRAEHNDVRRIGDKLDEFVVEVWSVSEHSAHIRSLSSRRR
jgi:hypothetical protein